MTSKRFSGLSLHFFIGKDFTTFSCLSGCPRMPFIIIITITSMIGMIRRGEHQKLGIRLLLGAAIFGMCLLALPLTRASHSAPASVNEEFALRRTRSNEEPDKVSSMVTDSVSEIREDGDGDDKIVVFVVETTDDLSKQATEDQQEADKVTSEDEEEIDKAMAGALRVATV